MQSKLTYEALRKLERTVGSSMHTQWSQKGDHVTLPCDNPVQSASWAFTLRKTNLKKMKNDHHLFREYEDKIIRLNKLKGCKVQEYYYEMTGGRHIHGILKLSNTFNHKLLRTRGWNMDEKSDPDEGWVQYMKKDQCSYRDPDRNSPSNKSMFK